MKSLIFLFAVFTIALAKVAPVVEVSPDKADLPTFEIPSKAVDTTVLLVDDIDTYQKQHPQEVLIEIPLDPIQPRVGIRYTVGNRNGIDRLVAQKTDYAYYAGPTDVVLTLTYPASGQGAVVTFVQIDVNQSTNIGRAYISAGGIGQRFIRIVVEARATTYFQYKTQIFGF